jgi:hypothetical protein
MANSFNEIKENSDQRSKRIRAAALDEERKKAKGGDDKFIIKALRKSRNFAAAERLESCGRGSYCGFVYCSVCRKRHAGKLLKRIQTHRQDYQLTDADVLERFRWVTILHSLEICDVDDLKAATKKARQEFNNFKRKWNATWVQGVMEYELVDMMKVKNLTTDDGEQSRKRTVLLDMLEDDYDYRKSRFRFSDGITYESDIGLKRTDYILVHSHFLMDAGKYANEKSWDAIKRDLKKRWQGNWHVLAKRLYKRKGQNENKEVTYSVDNTFEKTSSYSFKNRLKFNYTFGNYKWEEELEDENYFSLLQANIIFNIYDEMSGENNSGLLLGWESK